MESRGPNVTGIVKERYLSGPALARLNSSRRFYINTYWFKYVMVVVLMQSDVSEEAIKSETQENDCGNPEFDKSLEGICLQPIYFISISTVSPLENSRHGFVVEESAVMWSILKFKEYLWG